MSICWLIPTWFCKVDIAQILPHATSVPMPRGRRLPTSRSTRQRAIAKYLRTTSKNCSLQKHCWKVTLGNLLPNRNRNVGFVLHVRLRMFTRLIEPNSTSRNWYTRGGSPACSLACPTPHKDRPGRCCLPFNLINSASLPTVTYTMAIAWGVGHEGHAAPPQLHAQTQLPQLHAQPPAQSAAAPALRTGSSGAG